MDEELKGILDRFYSDRRNYELKKYNAYSQAIQEIEAWADKRKEKKDGAALRRGEVRSPRNQKDSGSNQETA